MHLVQTHIKNSILIQVVITMSKASLQKAGNETVNSAATHDNTPLVPEPAFSNGELGQLQEILFGQQQRSTHEQLNTLQAQFSEQLSSLGNVLNSRMNQLTESFEKSNTHFEQQLAQITSDNQAALDKLSQNMLTTKATLQTDITALSESNSEQAKRLHAELAEQKTKLLSEVSDTKHDLRSEISQAISGLQNSKLDRQGLAQLLKEVSSKLEN